MVKPARPAVFHIAQPRQTLVRCIPWFLSALMVLWVAGATACKNKPGKQVGTNGEVRAGLPSRVADSVSVAHNIDSADYVTLFKNKTNAWLYKMLMNKQNR